MKELVERFRAWQKKDEERARQHRDQHKLSTKVFHLYLIVMGWSGGIFGGIFTFELVTGQMIWLAGSMTYDLPQLLVLSIVLWLGFAFLGVKTTLDLLMHKTTLLDLFEKSGSRKND
jgi:hypothetical protein